MGLFGPGKTEKGNQTYNPPKIKPAKAAKVARRGGSAIAATTSAPRAGRVTRARGGSR